MPVGQQPQRGRGQDSQQNQRRAQQRRLSTGKERERSVEPTPVTVVGSSSVRGRSCEGPRTGCIVRTDTSLERQRYGAPACAEGDREHAQVVEETERSFRRSMQHSQHSPRAHSHESHGIGLLGRVGQLLGLGFSQSQAHLQVDSDEEEPVVQSPVARKKKSRRRRSSGAPAPCQSLSPRQEREVSRPCPSGGRSGSGGVSSLGASNEFQSPQPDPMDEGGSSDAENNGALANSPSKPKFPCVARKVQFGATLKHSPTEPVKESQAEPESVEVEEEQEEEDEEVAPECIKYMGVDYVQCSAADKVVHSLKNQLRFEQLLVEDLNKKLRALADTIARPATRAPSVSGVRTFSGQKGAEAIGASAVKKRLQAPLSARGSRNA